MTVNAYPFVVTIRPELAACAETHAAWARANDREKASRGLFREAVAEARDAGAKLDEIAGALGVTRQAVQKVMREVRRAQDERDAEVAWLERETRKIEAEQRRGLAVKTNCFVCGRFKPAPSAVCDFCGDDPVTHNGSRQDFDASYAGGVR